MSEFTTIQVRKETKTKLDLVKGENNNSYNDIIEKLLAQSGGIIVDDVVEIKREQVAFTLKYWNEDTQKILHVTYLELSNTHVGDKFIAEEFPSGDKFFNSSAEVILKAENEVLLKVEEVKRHKSKLENFQHILHVSLF